MFNIPVKSALCFEKAQWSCQVTGVLFSLTHTQIHKKKMASVEKIELLLQLKPCCLWLNGTKYKFIGRELTGQLKHVQKQSNKYRRKENCNCAIFTYVIHNEAYLVLFYCYWDFSIFKQ